MIQIVFLLVAFVILFLKRVSITKGKELRRPRTFVAAGAIVLLQILIQALHFFPLGRMGGLLLIVLNLFCFIIILRVLAVPKEVASVLPPNG